jgi:hypothetical protein
MAVEMRELYRSLNGDRWYLARNADLGQVFIRHEPNLPSGGETRHIEVGAFLSRGAEGLNIRSYCGWSGRWWLTTIPLNAKRVPGSNRTPGATLWN